jgi:ubiquinone/menaquinone biosynthesis C-methylase UbiE
MSLQAGQRILEIGPGPGRLLIPAAERVLPDGEAVGIDIQPGMIERLKQRAKKAGLTNLTAIVGDATEPHVDEASFDLVFLVTTLGEICFMPPDIDVRVFGGGRWTCALQSHR